MRRLGRLAVAVLVAACTVGVVGLAVQAASGVQNANPWWFEDDYTSLGYVDTAASTAAVDPSGTGTVSLPAIPAGLAFDPAASVGVIATQSGVDGWAFDGSAMVRASQFDVPGSGFLAAAWIDPAGNQLAVATSSQVTLQGWTGSAWSPVASLAVSGVTGIAEGSPVAGSPASILVGEPTGFEVAGYQGSGLAVDAGAGVSGLTGVAGVASAPGGSMAAVWAGAAVHVYGWDGSAYQELTALEPPASGAPVEAVAWFRNGNGYWVLTQAGALVAYAFDGSGVVQVASLTTSLTLPVLALATGWRQGDVAALVPGGWTYYDGSPIAADAARSVTGLTLPVYASSAVLQSIVLTVNHTIDQMQVDAAVPQLPAGTSVAYQVSTDGGAAWTAVTPCVNPTDPQTQCAADNTAVPAGSQVVYRLLLATTHPTVTPVVDTTDIYEIATMTQSLSNGMALLIR